MTTSLKKEGNISRVHSITKDMIEHPIKPTQDTPKESYLFCPSCENDFSKHFETRIANSFYRDFLRKKNQFNVHFRKYELSYNVYTSVDYITFKKFIFLQLYRTSVCNLSIKNNVTLTKDQMDILHKNLSDPTFFQDIKTLVLTTDFHWSKTENLIFCGAVNSNTYILWINEFIFIIQFDPSEIQFRLLEHAANFNNNSPRIILASHKLWGQFTNGIVNLILKKPKAST